jgi:hypothetical protein
MYYQSLTIVITLNAQIDNMNGFLLVGFGTVATTKPEVVQLLNQKDGKNTTISLKSLLYAAKSVPVTFTISNTIEGNDYFMYICALSEVSTRNYNRIRRRMEFPLESSPNQSWPPKSFSLSMD